MSVICQINCVGGIKWIKHAHAQSQVFGWLKPTCDTRVIHFDYMLEALAWMKKKYSLRNDKLKANRASETEEQRKERLRIRRENEKIENHEKQPWPLSKD